MIALCLAFNAQAQSGEGYSYFVDLNTVSNDKVKVVLRPPQVQAETIQFMFPAMVPGTYEVYDFGRFISDFKVKGKGGAAVKVEKVNVNTYKISPASLIEEISYKVDDTFDKSDLEAARKKVVFEPGGTNFEEGRNFSINNHSMFGYYEGMTRRPFKIAFSKPRGFYPATGLSTIQLGEQTDTISASDYHLLVDSPILYALPDTSFIEVAGTRILVAVYSPAKKMTAAFIANTLKDLLLAQKEYLGGELPVKKYAFLFYFHPLDKPTLSGASGALEHSYSSFYVLPEFDPEVLQQQIRDVAAHEFFHIVTPLTIHSEEIGNFDFNDPKMSRHLWLYEGMTEYAAHHAQVKGGLIDVNQFLNVMMQKYQNSREMYNDTMSFTFMSKNVLDPKIHEQYGNVYEKGAVIGMCLDILLRDLSEGKYGTQDLLHDLSKKYGKDSAFKDEQLFAEIRELTYPEVGDFLTKHVGGNIPLPMEDILERIGIKFSRQDTSMEFTLGNPDLGYNPESNRLIIEGVSNTDSFGKALGYKRKDELYKLNGAELKVEDIRNIVAEYYQNLNEGDMVKIEVYRPGWLFKKRMKLKSLTAPAQKVQVVRENQITMVDELSEKQRQTIKAWIGL